MTKHFTCLLSILFWNLSTGAVWAAEPAPAESMESTLKMPLNMDQRKLSNGLTVIMIEDFTFPVVSYQTWFRVGSVDEKPGATGLAHLFEHLMFKGTKRFGPKEFFQRLETRGAEVNAYTTRDYTVYYQNFSPPLLPTVIDMEADRMQGLVLNQSLLDTERMVVFEERKIRTDNSPAGKMQEALWLLAFREHPYRNPVIGIPQDLLAMNLEGITKFYKTHYVPSNAAVIVVGAFDREKTFELIKKTYESIPAAKQPSREDIKDEPFPDTERQLQLDENIASEQFSVAYPIPSARDPDSYAIDVLTNILFQGSSSRVFNDLVEVKDLATGVSGNSLTPAYPGLLMIGGVMRIGKKSQTAIDAMDLIFDQVKKQGVRDDEVKTAVRQLTVQTFDNLRTGFGLGQLVGVVHSVLGKASLVRDEISKYSKVTPADVKRVANMFLQPNHRSLIFMTPKTLTARKL